MPLFDVPGWNVSGAPVTESQPSKKRKRGRDEDKVQSAEINFEKLMEKLDAQASGADHPSKKKKKPKPQRSAAGSNVHNKMAHTRQDGAEPKQKRIERKQKATTPRGASAVQSESGLSEKKGKKSKVEHAKLADSQHVPNPNVHGRDHEPKDGLTVLQAGMKNSLDGARFRWINEVLYKSDSQHAHQMMRENPKVYEEYHTGFRHQVHSWPTNPVSHYISSLSSYSPRTVIADLGCGDAALARALVPHGMTVLSFDLVSDGVYIVEADTCGKLPLPGSEDTEAVESGEGEGSVVDVVVCALSLMGTNWPNCVREAWRILKPGGELKIAEVTSRFMDVEEFASLISSIGFRLKSKDDRNTHFTLFDFKKVARKAKSEKEWNKLLSRGSILKPCEYKRR
ncbi:hypothetical protein AcW1_004621 [Taiwanofungus camphoratus]|nr:hypothetical protein AcV7_008334 [Antrodia cinnamomea]KAI0959953.1 hypothetical protein AcW1_004621 [Antrodia cinnamomea]